jgi:hypothetical protein
MPSLRASRSSRSSPFVTATNTPDTPTVEPKREIQTTLDGFWQEPAPRTPIPSFEESGHIRQGVLQTMAPLGALPPQAAMKIKFRVNTPLPQDTRTEETKALLPAIDLMELDSKTPAGSPRPAEPPLKVEASKTAFPPLESTIPQLQNKSVPQEDEHTSNGVVATPRPAKSPTKMVTPKQAHSRRTSTSRSTPQSGNRSAYSVRTLSHQSRMPLDAVVDAAVERSRSMGQPILGLAIKRLYQESQHDPALSVVLTAILHQDASKEQHEEFTLQIKKVKKQLKVEEANVRRLEKEKTMGTSAHGPPKSTIAPRYSGPSTIGSPGSRTPPHPPPPLLNFYPFPASISTFRPSQSSHHHSSIRSTTPPYPPSHPTPSSTNGAGAVEDTMVKTRSGRDLDIPPAATASNADTITTPAPVAAHDAIPAPIAAPGTDTASITTPDAAPASDIAPGVDSTSTAAPDAALTAATTPDAVPTSTTTPNNGLASTADSATGSTSTSSAIAPLVMDDSSTTRTAGTRKARATSHASRSAPVTGSESSFTSNITANDPPATNGDLTGRSSQPVAAPSPPVASIEVAEDAPAPGGDPVPRRRTRNAKAIRTAAGASSPKLNKSASQPAQSSPRRSRRKSTAPGSVPPKATRQASENSSEPDVGPVIPEDELEPVTVMGDDGSTIKTTVGALIRGENKRQSGNAPETADSGILTASANPTPVGTSPVASTLSPVDTPVESDEVQQRNRSGSGGSLSSLGLSDVDEALIDEGPPSQPDSPPRTTKGRGGNTRLTVTHKGKQKKTGKRPAADAELSDEPDPEVTRKRQKRLTELQARNEENKSTFAAASHRGESAFRFDPDYAASDIQIRAGSRVTHTTPKVTVQVSSERTTSAPVFSSRRTRGGGGGDSSKQPQIDPLTANAPDLGPGPSTPRSQPGEQGTKKRKARTKTS